ncbi:hypothetical protein [Pontiella sulfatireligans]|uniref:Uncharacterized protein n=1 Tax=Pontiella sulfatireligans TaxID=2750658 RepID=A0A6C2UHF4_9BACT|nr:hypothetical protein [Pontiella sulfatireligans]VGO18841.1 hypothetical protein SCARR_00894 [Pontiella sulfatireligans]
MIFFASAVNKHSTTAAEVDMIIKHGFADHSLLNRKDRLKTQKASRIWRQ